MRRRGGRGRRGRIKATLRLFKTICVEALYSTLPFTIADLRVHGSDHVRFCGHRGTVVIRHTEA